jgi:hypothetical protein
LGTVEGVWIIIVGSVDTWPGWVGALYFRQRFVFSISKYSLESLLSIRVKPGDELSARRPLLVKYSIFFVILYLAQEFLIQIGLHAHFVNMVNILRGWYSGRTAGVMNKIISLRSIETDIVPYQSLLRHHSSVRI